MKTQKELTKNFSIIIRCKDCKHYSCRCCHLFDGLTLPAPDDFCSYAERKSEVKRCFDIPKEVADRLFEDTERRESE